MSAQAFADHFRAAVLPDDRRPVRRARSIGPRPAPSRPDWPARSRRAGGFAGGSQRLAAGRDHARPTAPPDRARPRHPSAARTWIDASASDEHCAVVGDDHRLRGRGALIDRQHGHGSDTITAPSTCPLQSRSMAFTGFPAEAIRFYEGLIADNIADLLAGQQAGASSGPCEAPMLALARRARRACGRIHVFRPEQGCAILQGQDAVQGSHRRVRRVGGRSRLLRAVLGDRDGRRLRLLPHGRRPTRPIPCRRSTAMRVGGEIVAITERLRQQGTGVLGDRSAEDGAAWVSRGITRGSNCCD